MSNDSATMAEHSAFVRLLSTTGGMVFAGVLAVVAAAIRLSLHPAENHVRWLGDIGSTLPRWAHPVGVGIYAIGVGASACGLLLVLLRVRLAGHVLLVGIAVWVAGVATLFVVEWQPSWQPTATVAYMADEGLRQFRQAVGLGCIPFLIGTSIVAARGQRIGGAKNGNRLAGQMFIASAALAITVAAVGFLSELAYVAQNTRSSRIYYDPESTSGVARLAGGFLLVAGLISGLLSVGPFRMRPRSAGIALLVAGIAVLGNLLATLVDAWMLSEGGSVSGAIGYWPPQSDDVWLDAVNATDPICMSILVGWSGYRRLRSTPPGRAGNGFEVIPGRSALVPPAVRMYNERGDRTE